MSVKLHTIRERRAASPPARPDGVLLLDFDARQRRRARVKLASGEEIGVNLPRGTLLADGDWLETDDGRAIIVRAAPEELSVVTSGDALLLSRIAYHLGNRHVPLAIAPGRLAYRHDHVLDDMVRRLGVQPTFEHAPFVPERGAYDHSHPPAHSHSHSHSHPHSHDHSPPHDHAPSHPHPHSHSHSHDTSPSHHPPHEHDGDD